jgi:hypothetical protein
VLQSCEDREELAEIADEQASEADKRRDFILENRVSVEREREGEDRDDRRMKTIAALARSLTTISESNGP